MNELIKPTTITIKNKDGDGKDFILSRLPATVAREIVAKYPIAAMPKIGEYKVSEETMLLMLKYVAVLSEDGREIRLSTKALVDNHVSDVVQLLRLEYEMLELNTGFMGGGRGRGFLDSLLQKFSQSIMPTLIHSLRQSSQPDSQPM